MTFWVLLATYETYSTYIKPLKAIVHNGFICSVQQALRDKYRDIVVAANAIYIPLVNATLVLF